MAVSRPVRHELRLVTLLSGWVLDYLVGRTRYGSPPYTTPLFPPLVALTWVVPLLLWCAFSLARAGRCQELEGIHKKVVPRE